jgi:hypothetical protein
VKPNPKYALSVDMYRIPQIPNNVSQGLKDKGWRQAMCEELQALEFNNVWTLVPQTRNQHIIHTKFIKLN